MSELDYQVALLLQHKFEQEHRSKTNFQKSDQELARLLQEQFEHEANVDTPTSSLVYDKPKRADDSRCLIDPSWELVDPTPDIHALFVAFDRRFFWNKLVTVCVSWSKRMTSCAGYCSYQGRGGMCHITMSEPLLKLRPRKDLVETLLHEMIHAYLFVTHNNSDRDGHGPNFHEHMHRINRESGTNITVYHTFHDEVRLYKQHWWRCNGPCQHRKPFFGMVRRATNRAPGLNDRWWARHSINCGGTFIKVKEPEKKVAKKKGEKIPKTDPKTDIRNFMPVLNKPSTTGANVKTYKDLNLNRPKWIFNSTSTVVVTKTKTKTDVGTPAAVVSVNDYREVPRAVTAPSPARVTDEFLAVRNHWQNKFGAGSSQATGNKRPSPQREGGILKIPKTSASATVTSPSVRWKNPISTTRIIESADPTPETAASTYPTSETVASTSLAAVDFVSCPICSKRVLMLELNDHLDLCLSGQPEEAPPPKTVDLTRAASEAGSQVTQSGATSEVGLQECPLCSSSVSRAEFSAHVDRCVSKIDDFESADVEGDQTSCLVCGKRILRGDLDSHLDECMVDIFDDGKGDNAESEDDKCEVRDGGSLYNCPFCLTMVEEAEMKDHIDGCLSAVDSGVVDCLINDDF